MNYEIQTRNTASIMRACEITKFNDSTNKKMSHHSKEAKKKKKSTSKKGKKKHLHIGREIRTTDFLTRCRSTDQLSYCQLNNISPVII